MTDDGRRFENGRWWQWDGERWLLEPEAPAAVEPSTAILADSAVPTGSRSAPEPPHRSKAKPLIAVMVVLALVGAGVVAVVLLKHRQQSSVLADAYSTCKLAGKQGAGLADGGSTLTLDTVGEKDITGLSIGDLACTLIAVKAPSSVTTDMDQTRALDGKQTAMWDSIKATWRYHPSTGIEVTLTTT
jgi:hypothetical protein